MTNQRKRMAIRILARGGAVVRPEPGPPDDRRPWLPVAVTRRLGTGLPRTKPPSLPQSTPKPQAPHVPLPKLQVPKVPLPKLRVPSLLWLKPPSGAATRTPQPPADPDAGAHHSAPEP